MSSKYNYKYIFEYWMYAIIVYIYVFFLNSDKDLTMKSLR